jgi:hypothetical protein
MPLSKFLLLRGDDYFLTNTVEVRHGIRRIHAQWSPELAQDIEAYHNINVEEELTRLLSEELSREIDSEIINTIRQDATTIVQDLVPIQPMNEPVGQLFYFDYSYNKYTFKNFKLLRG